MRKRLLAVLLATAMATTMVAGCGLRDNRSVEEDEDDDEDDDDDDKEDDEHQATGGLEDVQVNPGADFSMEISADSILCGVDSYDIRVFYGDYQIDGDVDSEAYYENVKALSSDVITVKDSFWHENVEVYNFPSKIIIGKLGGFFKPAFYTDDYSSVSYTNGYYYSSNPDSEDLAALKMDLISKYGDVGIEYYKNAITSYDMSFALISFPEADSKSIGECGAVVELEGNQLHFYNYTYNEDQTVDVLDEIYSCYVDFNGVNLEVGSNGSIVEMVPYDFRTDSYSYIYSNAFVEDKNGALDGLSGFFLYDDGMDGVGDFTHGYMANGDESYSYDDAQQFVYSIEDGTISIDYYINVVSKNGRVEYLDDEESEHKHIEGRFIWCDDQGMVIRVGNKLYYFLSNAENYYSSVYGNNGMPENSGQNGASFAGSLNIHEQVSTALSNALGDDADVDTDSGAVTMNNNILFGVDSAEISDEGKEYLDDFIDTYVNTIKPYLDDGSVTSIVIEGHTDPDGSYEYNLELSERRAQAVAEYVIARQPELADVTVTVGYSYLYPVYDANGNVDKAASRRVVFSFVSQ